MDYDTWMKNKEECQNYDMRPWCKMTEPARIAMINAHAAGAGIEGIGLDGLWFCAPEPRWHKGNIYRVSPSWPGPAKLETKPEYVDKNVFRSIQMYRFIHPEIGEPWRVTTAPSMVGFAGYVYEAAGREWCSPELIFDKQDDGTCRLRVPKAVRLRKGADV